MKIGRREIGPWKPPYIVAEISGEHLGDIERCKTLIAKAYEAGADAAKLQLFDPQKLASARGGKDKVVTSGLWKGRTLGDLYDETHTPREWFPSLFRYARSLGITLFSSVFDVDDVGYLEDLGCPAYKISSFEMSSTKLVQKVADTGKPVIISTGLATAENILDVRDLFDIKNYVFLHCVSEYPCPIEAANLKRIKSLMRFFPIVGLSDHTLGWIAPVAATAMGVCVIEKHITLLRDAGGPDASFSMEPSEFSTMVHYVNVAYRALGQGGDPNINTFYAAMRVT